MKYHACLALGSLAVLSAAAPAVTFDWTGPSGDTGNPLHARASFTASGNVLTIVLSNLSTGPSASPADTLGTLVWNMPGTIVTPSLTNAVTLGASTVIENNASYGSSFDLNKEYMYANNLTLASNTFQHGISSVGIGVFATNNDTFYERLRGEGNAGSTPSDAFSIASAAGTTGAANNFPLVKNSITVTLLSSAPVNLANISNVGFSFGSGAQTVGIVPEPTSLAFVGLAALAAFKKRRPRPL
jgi:hypothetical protein